MAPHILFFFFFLFLPPIAFSLDRARKSGKPPPAQLHRTSRQPPTKCEEKRPEGANPRTGYRARLLGKETYAYTAPGAMDNRDDRATERSGAEEKEEGTAPQEKGRGRKAPAKKAPGRGETKTQRKPQTKRGRGEGGREGSGTATPPDGGKEAS